jgi:hypothetical protein
MRTRVLTLSIAHSIARIAYGAAFIACVVACTSSSGGPPPPSDGGPEQSDAGVYEASADTGGPADAGVTPTYRVLLLGRNDLCLPAPLPTLGGMATCRVLLEGVSAGCTISGLSPATTTDMAGIDADLQRRGFTRAPGAVCALVQLAPSPTVASGCADESASGWCYVNGRCSADAGTNCQEAMCATTGFDVATGYTSPTNHPAYVQAWLGCP